MSIETKNDFLAAIEVAGYKQEQSFNRRIYSNEQYDVVIEISTVKDEILIFRVGGPCYTYSIDFQDAFNKVSMLADESLKQKPKNSNGYTYDYQTPVQSGYQWRTQ